MHENNSIPFTYKYVRRINREDEIQSQQHIDFPGEYQRRNLEFSMAEIDNEYDKCFEDKEK